MVPEKSGCGAMIVMLAALLFGSIFGISSVSTSGSAEPMAAPDVAPVPAPVGISCAVNPSYCVPLTGSDATYPELESASSRTLDAASTAAPGVVRYLDDNHIPTLGDPAAPIHFIVVMDFACPHCQNYHSTDLPHFITDDVLTGKATLGAALITAIGGQYSLAGSQAAVCAGEQGAFWEMTDLLFQLASSQGIQTGFTPESLLAAAQDLGMDTGAFQSCLDAGRYTDLLTNNYVFAADHGISSVPSMLSMTSGDWSIVDRSYDTLHNLTADAQP
jgi:protein-disulfide isomerase